MLFERRKNTELLVLWDPGDPEGLASLVQNLCERSGLRELGLYRDDQENGLIREVVGSSADYVPEDDSLPQRYKMREQWHRPQVLKEPFPGMVVAPLFVKERREGIVVGRFSSRTNQSKASRLVFESAPLLARALRTSLDISERDKRIQKFLRQADAGRTTLGGAVSISALVRILMAQCAQAIGYDGALFCELSEQGSILTRFSWQVPETLSDPTQNLRNCLLEIDLLGSELLVTAAESDKLEPLGIRSVLALPLGSESNGILALISRDLPRTTGSDDLATLRAYADQLSTVLQRESAFTAFENAYLETLYTTVTAIELSRAELRGHHGRVTHLSERISEQLAFPPERKECLLLAAAFHDVGLLGGADATVNAALEFQHPDIGASMVAPLPKGEAIAQIIAEHHETFEGFGFPSAISGDEISLEGQILALAEFIVERTTASTIAPANSLQNTRLIVEKDADRRFSGRVAKAGMKVLSEEVESAFVGASCVSRKSCPQNPCSTCGAETSDAPCWETDQASRQCAQHGDLNCEGCYVWLTWGPGRNSRNG